MDGQVECVLSSGKGLFSIHMLEMCFRRQSLQDKLTLEVVKEAERAEQVCRPLHHLCCSHCKSPQSSAKLSCTSATRLLLSGLPWAAGCCLKYCWMQLEAELNRMRAELDQMRGQLQDEQRASAEQSRRSEQALNYIGP